MDSLACSDPCTLQAACPLTPCRVRQWKTPKRGQIPKPPGAVCGHSQPTPAWTPFERTSATKPGQSPFFRYILRSPTPHFPGSSALRARAPGVPAQRDRASSAVYPYQAEGRRKQMRWGTRTRGPTHPSLSLSLHLHNGKDDGKGD